LPSFYSCPCFFHFVLFPRVSLFNLLVFLLFLCLCSFSLDFVLVVLVLLLLLSL
jgi:hypothetical protein